MPQGTSTAAPRSLGEREKLFAIATREIRHRTDRPFVPEIAIGKRRDVAHVDSAANYGAAAFQNAQRRRHQRPDRREDDGRVQSFGWRFIRAAGPGRAKTTREFLPFGIAGPREFEDFAAFEARDLRHDVRRGAESVKAEPFRVAGFAKRAIPDQAGAE